MSNASNFLENALLDHVLTTTAFTPPTTRFLALFTNTSGNATANLEAGTLTDEVSTSGTGYGRQAITFGAAVAGTSANNATVTFDPAASNLGTITHVAVMDAETAGNVLFHGAVVVAKAIDTSDVFQITTGNLTIALD